MTEVLDALRALDVREALSPGAARFLEEHEEALLERLAPLDDKLAAAAAALPGEAGALIRQRMGETTSPLERYLWARIGAHLVRAGYGLGEATKRASEDLLSFATTMNLY